MTKKQQAYDITIVGGGMVGATLACALGNKGFNIALIETVTPDTAWPKEKFDIRVSAITRATVNVFKAIGAWQGMVDRRVCPYRNMHVWDASGDGVIHFDSAEIGEPDLGHIAENSVIQAALWDRLDHIPAVTRYCPAQCHAIEWHDDYCRVTLEDAQVIESQLLVGADGGRSWVRTQAGIHTIGWQYQQTAVVGTVKTAEHHRDTAWQRFLPDGPLAFLPMPDGYSAIVWSTTAEHAEALIKLNKRDFLEELHQSFGNSLGQMKSVGPRGAFPLRLSHTEEYVRPRLALIGDAAHSIHPLAGQGVNLGVADAASLVQVILEARQKQQDIGRLQVLRRYERWRKGENLTMLAAMDGFKRLFSNDQTLLRWTRNVGLNLTNQTPPLKHFFMRQALGTMGDLPELAKQVAE
jgi:2-octaprenylphenol hydroxylase